MDNVIGDLEATEPRALAFEALQPIPEKKRILGKERQHSEGPKPQEKHSQEGVHSRLSKVE